MMRPSTKKVGNYYQPVIVYWNTKREIIWGPPLATKAAALKYARLHIAERNQHARRL